jgi:hypothetical protein
MEISDIKRRIVETVERAKRQSAERRTRHDTAAREYETFLERTAVPLFKQIANVLRAEGFMFTVFTPGGSVRLMSDRSTEDYIELLLDTSGDEPVVMGHTGRSRGRRVIESEQTIGAPGTMTEDDVLSFVMQALPPFVER